MNAAERRIIHRFVEKENGLRTLTIGEGERKRIVIFSAKQSEKEVLSKSKKYSQHRSKSTDPQTKNKSGSEPRFFRCFKTPVANEQGE